MFSSAVLLLLATTAVHSYPYSGGYHYGSAVERSHYPVESREWSDPAYSAEESAWPLAEARAIRPAMRKSPFVTPTYASSYTEYAPNKFVPSSAEDGGTRQYGQGFSFYNPYTAAASYADPHSPMSDYPPQQASYDPYPWAGTTGYPGYGGPWPGQYSPWVNPYAHWHGNYGHSHYTPPPTYYPHGPYGGFGGPGGYGGYGGYGGHGGYGGYGGYGGPGPWSPWGHGHSHGYKPYRPHHHDDDFHSIHHHHEEDDDRKRSETVKSETTKAVKEARKADHGADDMNVSETKHHGVVESAGKARGSTTGGAAKRDSVKTESKVLVVGATRGAPVAPK